MSKRVQKNMEFNKSGINTDIEIIPMPSIIIDLKLSIVKKNKDWERSIGRFFNGSKLKLTIKNESELLNAFSKIKDKDTTLKFALEILQSDDKKLLFNALIKYIKTIGKQKYYLICIYSRPPAKFLLFSI